MLCPKTQTSFNESSQSSSARNSNNTCECRSDIEKIRQDIVTILSKLKTKDSEIELLNGEITTAYTVIQLLQQSISESEEKDRRRGNQQEETPRVWS